MSWRRLLFILKIARCIPGCVQLHCVKDELIPVEAA